MKKLVWLGILLGAVIFAWGWYDRHEVEIDEQRARVAAMRQSGKKEEPAKPAPVTVTKVLTVGADWVGIEVPVGWSIDAKWGNAPLDVRIDQDPRKVHIMPPGPKGFGIMWYQEWRMNREFEGEAEVTVTLTQM